MKNSFGTSPGVPFVFPDKIMMMLRAVPFPSSHWCEDKWCGVIHPLGILIKRLPTPSPKVIMIHLSGSREIGFGRLIPCRKSSVSYGSATVEAF